MAFFVFFTIADADGETSTVEIPINDTTATTVLAAFTAAVGALINPLVTGGLRKAGVRLEFDISGTWGPVAQLNSDVQEKATFAMRTAGNFPTRLSLPTFDEAFFVAGTSNVDLTDSDVQAWIDFLEDGITVSSTLVQPTDYREDDIVDVESAYEDWGKRRRR